MTEKTMERAPLDLEALVLSSGGHSGPDDGFCVMEATSYLAGEPWTDRPVCVCPTLAAFLRSWNDAASDENRQGLKRYIPRLAGTNDGREELRTWILVDWTLREQLPLYLDVVEAPEAKACAAGLRGRLGLPL